MNQLSLKRLGLRTIMMEMLEVANIIQNTGYECSQIWQPEYPEETDTECGINFSRINDEREVLFLEKEGNKLLISMCEGDATELLEVYKNITNNIKEVDLNESK